MHRLSRYRVFSDNAVQVLVDALEAYPAMLEAIASAQKSLILESYIFANDLAGERFRDALVARARAGVEVRVLVDGVGSRSLSSHFFAPLIQAGGSFAVFRPWHPWWPRRGFWKRDHRKLLIVDGCIAFLGGLNISLEYAPKSWGGEAWHDFHARLQGPVVRELLAIFDRTWQRVTKLKRQPLVEEPSSAGSVAVQVLESRISQQLSVRHAYLNAIRHAAQSVQICNAYCIPDGAERRALLEAVERGVHVQLFLAGKTDVPAVRYASRATYAALLAGGVEIYEWQGPVLHAKCAVVDGEWCCLGSYNMDNISLRHNLELNIACHDTVMVARIAEQLKKDVQQSQRIDALTWHRRSWREKLLEWFWYGFRNFL